MKLKRNKEGLIYIRPDWAEILLGVQGEGQDQSVSTGCETKGAKAGPLPQMQLLIWSTFPSAKSIP